MHTSQVLEQGGGGGGGGGSDIGWQREMEARWVAAERARVEVC